MLRVLSRALPVLLLLGLCGPAEAQRSAPALTGRTDLKERPLPNVLVVLVDDVSWSDVDSLPTPNIDYLADEGVSFRRAYVQPYCSPTRYSILFGTQPFREGLGFWINTGNEFDVSVPLDRVALPRCLNNLGYKTLMTGKWHLNTVALGVPLLYEAPRLFGFQSYRSGWIGNLGGTWTYEDWNRIDDGQVSRTTEYATSATVDATLEWWQETVEPKFAYVAFHAPHAPFHAAPSNLLPQGYVIGPGIRGLYESMLVALDTELGRLLDVVDLQNTMVFFVSDNGTPEPATAPSQDPDKVKASVYEAGINVPFIVAGYGAPRNRTSQALISSTDMYATILDLIREVPPAGQAMDSVSFLEQIYDPDLPAREWVYAHKFSPNGLGPFDCNRKAVVTDRYKLMVADGHTRLFDLQTDPDEENPLKIHHENKLIYAQLRRYMLSMKSQGAP